MCHVGKQGYVFVLTDFKTRCFDVSLWHQSLSTIILRLKKFEKLDLARLPTDTVRVFFSEPFPKKNQFVSSF